MCKIRIDTVAVPGSAQISSVRQAGLRVLSYLGGPKKPVSGRSIRAETGLGQAGPTLLKPGLDFEGPGQNIVTKAGPRKIGPDAILRPDPGP